MKPVDRGVGSMTFRLKSEAEALSGYTFSDYQPATYSTQVVAGLNIMVLVKTDLGDIMVTIFEPLPFTQKQPFVTKVEWVNGKPQ